MLRCKHKKEQSTLKVGVWYVLACVFARNTRVFLEFIYHSEKLVLGTLVGNDEPSATLVWCDKA